MVSPLYNQNATCLNGSNLTGLLQTGACAAPQRLSKLAYLLAGLILVCKIMLASHKPDAILPARVLLQLLSHSVRIL